MSKFYRLALGLVRPGKAFSYAHAAGFVMSRKFDRSEYAFVGDAAPMNMVVRDGREPDVVSIAEFAMCTCGGLYNISDGDEGTECTLVVPRRSAVAVARDLSEHITEASVRMLDSLLEAMGFTEGRDSRHMPDDVFDGWRSGSVRMGVVAHWDVKSSSATGVFALALGHVDEQNRLRSQWLSNVPLTPDAGGWETLVTGVPLWRLDEEGRYVIEEP